MNKITVSVPGKNSKKLGRSIKSIVRTAAKTLKILKKEGVGTEIYLVNGRTMRLLNKKFRGKDKATDILSFREPQYFVAPPSKFRKIGEIYLNAGKTIDYRLKTTAKNEKSVVCSPSTIDRLLVHGLLHLLGYDHESKNDTMKMEKAERRVFHAILG